MWAVLGFCGRRPDHGLRLGVATATVNGFAAGWSGRDRMVSFGAAAKKTHTPSLEAIPLLTTSNCDKFHSFLIRPPRSGIIGRVLENNFRLMLAWKNLSKSYGRRPLFAGLAGQMGEGEMLAVTGPNGSGKSTFLKILAGLVRADTGEVDRPGERNSVGYAAPDLSLYGELTGQENLQFFAQARGLGREAIDPLLEQVGLGRAGNKPVSTYSSGMRQRVRLCYALLHRPAILLLDEPTLALDSDGVAFVEQILAEHIQTGGCAVVATNDAREAALWGRDR